MPSSAGKKCARSEEHTSELQSHDNIVCRLLLEKKNLSDPARVHPRPPIGAPGTRPQVARALTGPRSAAPATRPRVGLIRIGAVVFFFFKDAATPEISPFSLHAALPI